MSYWCLTPLEPLLSFQWKFTTSTYSVKADIVLTFLLRPQKLSTSRPNNGNTLLIESKGDALSISRIPSLLNNPVRCRERPGFEQSIFYPYPSNFSEQHFKNLVCAESTVRLTARSVLPFSLVYRIETDILFSTFSIGITHSFNILLTSSKWQGIRSC